MVGLEGRGNVAPHVLVASVAMGENDGLSILETAHGDMMASHRVHLRTLVDRVAPEAIFAGERTTGDPARTARSRTGVIEVNSRLSGDDVCDGQPGTTEPRPGRLPPGRRVEHRRPVDPRRRRGHALRQRSDGHPPRARARELDGLLGVRRRRRRRTWPAARPPDRHDQRPPRPDQPGVEVRACRRLDDLGAGELAPAVRRPRHPPGLVAPGDRVHRAQEPPRAAPRTASNNSRPPSTSP